MRLRTWFAWMIRESRGSRGRMLYFAGCLAAGVAAVVGTAALAESVEAGFRARSRELLGADFRVESRRPVPDAIREAVAAIGGSRQVDVIRTPNMVSSAPGPDGRATSALATLHALSGPYPLYGEVATDPPGGLTANLAEDRAALASRLAEDIDVSPGDEVRIGGASFTVGAVVTGDAPGFGVRSLIAPSVYLTREGFERTGRLGFGTRLEYQTLFAIPGTLSEPELDRLVERLEEEVPEASWLDFDTHYFQNPGARRSTRRAEGFVGLVALLSLVVGGIGVSMIVRAWLAGRAPAVAVLRCLGMRPGEILALSLAHAVLLALAGSIVGAIAGCALPFLARAVAPDFFAGSAVAVLPVGAVLRGIGLGVGLALVFSLPPLTAIWRVPPSRVLRSDAEPLPPNRFVAVLATALLAAGIFAAASVQAAEVGHAVWFTAGFGALVLALLAGSRLLMWLAGRLPRRGLHPFLKHGVAALARPGAGTTGIAVALGLGAMVVTGTWIIQSKLRAAVLAEVPPDAPTAFLVDIPPGEWEAVRAELVSAGARGIQRAPVLMARISAIDDRPAGELMEEGDDRSRWALRRQQRLTWNEELPAGNEIVEGELWSRPEIDEVSVERRFASRIGVGIGSRIEFEADGAKTVLTVSSIREVRWRSMAMNFFLVAEPGSFSREPDFVVAGARIPAEREAEVQDRIAASFSSVTMIRVGPALEKVLGLLERIAGGVRLLGSFTALAGLAVLAGAVAAAAQRRGGEIALLKTLGVTRAGVAALLFTEYGLLGLTAGAVGAGGALLLAWAWLGVVADASVSVPVGALPVAALATALLTGLCGIAAGARALRIRPIESLRE